ncbi:MAG: iron chelate uptake ABC transporter family permease subunit [Verrucomicrobiae bacterium]|nr:iron chelate uptake ABC transporter family permease subunit [Verrucomicrobiae bacterium]
MNFELAARDIQFRYHQDGNAFRLEVSQLVLRPGEIHALIGPNGSGKSTFLRLMAGLRRPSAGTIELNGRPLHSHAAGEIAQTVAFLPQQVAPVFSLPVEEVILAGRHPWQTGMGLARPEDRHLVAEIIERLDLSHLRNRIFDTLSGGERQKVLIASILAQTPRLILLDEPTNALDIHHQVEVFHLLRQEAARGAGILAATHDLTLAGHFADRLTLMQGGRLICSGTGNEVLEENRLRKVYGPHLRVAPDPLSGNPCILPAIAIGEIPIHLRPANHGEQLSAAKPLPTSPCQGETLNKPLLAKEGMGRSEPDPLSKLINQKSPTENPVLSGGSFFRTMFLFGLAALAITALAPWLGGEKLAVGESLREMFQVSPDNWSVGTRILALRLPRVAMGFLAGMTLACVGASFQCLLRNPLAEPYTLGIASAAALGAVLAITWPALSLAVGPFTSVQVMAFLFALAIVFLLRRALASQRWRSGMTGLLLIGIALSLVCSSLILLIRYLANPLAAHAMDQWMIGSIEVSGWREPLPCLPFLIVGLTLVLAAARSLNQIALGEELAGARGVDVKKVQKQVLIGGSLATAAVVSITGPIAFLGLLTPHLVRGLVGADQRVVLPASLLAGGALMVAADTATRMLTFGGRGAELPSGILTGLVGGLFFIILLCRRQPF